MVLLEVPVSAGADGAGVLAGRPLPSGDAIDQLADRRTGAGIGGVQSQSAEVFAQGVVEKVGCLVEALGGEPECLRINRCGSHTG